MKRVRLQIIAASVALLSIFSASTVHAFGTASSEFFIGAIETTGTAEVISINLIGNAILNAGVTGGSPDPANDDSFVSIFGPTGESIAITDDFGSSSLVAINLAVPGMSEGFANTLADFEVLIIGEGSVDITLDFNLFIESFNNDDGFVSASFEAFDSFNGGGEFGIEAQGAQLMGMGLDDELSDSLILSFEALGFLSDDPQVEFFTAVTTANVGVTVVPVPAAVWLFGSALVGLAGFRRKAAAQA